jgi:hypothetical protein
MNEETSQLLVVPFSHSRSHGFDFVSGAQQI